jgi:hypothetical protein
MVNAEESKEERMLETTTALACKTGLKEVKPKPEYPEIMFKNTFLCAVNPVWLCEFGILGER